MTYRNIFICNVTLIFLTLNETDGSNETALDRFHDLLQGSYPLFQRCHGRYGQGLHSLNGGNKRLEAQKAHQYPQEDLPDRLTHLQAINSNRESLTRFQEKLESVRGIFCYHMDLISHGQKTPYKQKKCFENLLDCSPRYAEVVVVP